MERESGSVAVPLDLRDRHGGIRGGAVVSENDIRGTRAHVVIQRGPPISVANGPAQSVPYDGAPYSRRTRPVARGVYRVNNCSFCNATLWIKHILKCIVFPSYSVLGPYSRDRSTRSRMRLNSNDYVVVDCKTLFSKSIRLKLVAFEIMSTSNNLVE